MKNIILGIFFTIVFFFGTSETYAQCTCSAAGKSAELAFEFSDAVFVGEVVKVKKVTAATNQEKYNEFEVTFKIITAYKTDSDENITIQNTDSGDSDFAENESYLVYARLYKKKLYAGIGCCSRTKKLSDAKSDLEELGKIVGNKPRN